jgi:hypothetical protein
MEFKKIIKKEILESLNSVKITEDVTGDKDAYRTAKAKQRVSDVEERLGKWGGHNLPELKNLFTDSQLSIEPFQFSFVLQVPEVQESLNLPKPILFESLVSRVSNQKPFTLDIKGKDEIFTMTFDEKEMITNLPGTENSIRALKAGEEAPNGKFYNVKLSKDFLNVAKEKTENKEGDNDKDGENQTEDGGSKKGSGSENNEQFFNDLTGFFQFIVNNKNIKGGVKKESFFNEIDSILKEEGENVEKKPEEDKSFIGRVWLKNVKLAPKAEKRRRGDVESYEDSQDQSEDIDPNISMINLPNQGVNVKLSLKILDKNFTPEQQNSLKTIKNDVGIGNNVKQVSVKSSLSNKDYIIISYAKDKYLVCKIDKTRKLLNTLHKVQIQPNAGRQENLDHPINAQIEFTI